MVETPLAGLFIAVELVQPVVEVLRACAQEPPEQGGVRREDGGDVDLPDAAHDEADPGHPLVEVADDAGRGVGEVLRQMAEVPEELGNHEPGKKE